MCRLVRIWLGWIRPLVSAIMSNRIRKEPVNFKDKWRRSFEEKELSITLSFQPLPLNLPLSSFPLSLSTFSSVFTLLNDPGQLQRLPNLVRWRLGQHKQGFLCIEPFCLALCQFWVQGQIIADHTQTNSGYLRSMAWAELEVQWAEEIALMCQEHKQKDRFPEYIRSDQSQGFIPLVTSVAHPYFHKSEFSLFWTWVPL